MRLTKAGYVATVAFAILVGGGYVQAHHAFAAEFDATKEVTMTGTVDEMQWVNPHSWLYIMVTGADGKEERWGFEFGPPNALFRRGWTRSTVPHGMKVTVVAFLATDGRKVASAKTVKLPDGRSLFAGSEGTGAPTDAPAK
jgi:hypothetical protein